MGPEQDQIRDPLIYSRALSEFTYILRALYRLERHGAKLTFERYQDGGVCQRGWKGDPNNNSPWEKLYFK